MDREERIQKVMNALLAMQRRAWEQGVAAQAFLELGKTEWVVLLAKDAVVNQLKDGRLGVNEGTAPVVDPASNGEPLLLAAGITGDEQLKQAAGRMLKFLLEKAPRTSAGIIYHNFIENRIWADSFYMAPPFLAVAGHPQEALKQVAGYHSILFDPIKKLYHHIWDDDLQEFTRKEFWGVGNGWAAAGITRVIRALPEEMRAEKELVVGFMRQALDGCLHYQRADGLFHNILDDPNSFIETNAAQMLSYTIYRGVAGGWLDRVYLERADAMREAVYQKIDEFGLVQGVCGAPNFDRPGTAAEGQSFFLLMEAAHSDLS